jgi:hypothetical protein
MIRCAVSAHEEMIMINRHHRFYRPLELTETAFAQFENLTRRRFLIGAGWPWAC